MTVKEFLKQNIVYLDGGMGTILQKNGLLPGEEPERWNITHPEIITDIHRAYFDAGSNIVNTNTFGANLLKFSKTELEEIIKAAVENAKKAKENSTAKGEKFIALDIGPSGKLLKPYGDFEFEDAVELFAHTIRLGVKYGADLVFIETMNDSLETKAALLAAKENCDLPIFVSNAYGEDGKLMTGASPEAMVALLEAMGADAIGANCSLGPKQLEGVIEKLLEYSSLPIILKPNAGLPKSLNGETVFDVDPEEFSTLVTKLTKKGVSVIGGCCGTTPEYIKALKEKTKHLSPLPITKKNYTVASSYTNAVIFGNDPILIGERINPTGKKRFKQALIENDIDYILNEGVSQQEKGVHILDVNVGLPDIDEVSMLKKAVFELQAIIDLPLQIDTSDPVAMESALRIYNGKALINSVNGKEESMNTVFPLVKKYGGVVIALTLDENGIPSTAEGRVQIAKKIIATAEKYGIDKKDIIFDPLALTISTGDSAAVETLKALKTIKNELGCHTSLGVSNISFGLPNRDAINGVFFALALENGLSAAIMNPYSADMMKTYYAYRALKGFDNNCEEYIEKAENFITTNQTASVSLNTDNNFKSDLVQAIAKGLKEQSAQITTELLTKKTGLEIVNEDIIPALNIVGKGFEDKTVYLPQLLMSAEAAKYAFEVIKNKVNHSTDKTAKSNPPIVLATVKGDIHDIGKNIVKLLLENFGFAVTDLGKDVPPENILEAATRLNAPLVGLSALMTTTVPAMEQTISLIRKNLPQCKVIVGGAVLNEDYAKKIGADKYAKDAMEAVRYAEKLFK